MWGLFNLPKGPIDFRTFIAGQPVDDEFIDMIVPNVCSLICGPGAAAKLPLPVRIA